MLIGKILRRGRWRHALFFFFFIYLRYPPKTIASREFFQIVDVLQILLELMAAHPYLFLWHLLKHADRSSKSNEPAASLRRLKMIDIPLHWHFQ